LCWKCSISIQNFWPEVITASLKIVPHFPGAASLPLLPQHRYKMFRSSDLSHPGSHPSPVSMPTHESCYPESGPQATAVD